MSYKPTMDDWLGAIGMILLIVAAFIAAVAFSRR